MAGPGDKTAAGGGSLGHLRASRADREQAIDLLKAAFVQERLTKDEFDLRVGQLLASRTYAELAALTADIPAGLMADQPPSVPVRAQPRSAMNNGLKASICVAIAVAVAAVMTVATGGYALSLFVPFYLMALLAAGAQMLAARHDKRSHGQRPSRPSAATGGPHHPASANAQQAPQIDQAQRRTTEATRSRLPQPSLARWHAVARYPGH
jgi:Domain of unknown function (DUF1707)